jgi:hypothetical protein
VVKGADEKRETEAVNTVLGRGKTERVQPHLRSSSHFERGRGYTYRWANQVPLAEGDDVLKVNWCEVTVTDKDGKVLYHNARITDWPITEQNVAAVVTSGRARWKIKTSTTTHSRPRALSPTFSSQEQCAQTPSASGVRPQLPCGGLRPPRSSRSELREGPAFTPLAAGASPGRP